eukprot:Gb_41017 [translate_table: standard]
MDNNIYLSCASSLLNQITERNKKPETIAIRTIQNVVLSKPKNASKILELRHLLKHKLSQSHKNTKENIGAAANCEGSRAQHKGGDPIEGRGGVAGVGQPPCKPTRGYGDHGSSREATTSRVDCTGLRRPTGNRGGPSKVAGTRGRPQASYSGNEGRTGAGGATEHKKQEMASQPQKKQGEDLNMVPRHSSNLVEGLHNCDNVNIHKDSDCKDWISILLIMTIHVLAIPSIECGPPFSTQFEISCNGFLWSSSHSNQSGARTNTAKAGN